MRGMTPVDVMREVRNVFPAACTEGTFVLSGGALSPDCALLPEDWVALCGSLRNDGIYQLDAQGRIPGARDERFTGEVWLLRPPPEFLALCAEIIAWDGRNSRDAVTRESFGDYSWSRAVDRYGLPLDWRDAFAARLLPYRRMFREVSG